MDKGVHIQAGGERVLRFCHVLGSGQGPVRGRESPELVCWPGVLADQV